MEKFIRPSRIAALGVILAVLVFIYGTVLYKLQVVEGEEYLEKSTGSVAVTSTVNASRGSILDRNGVLLVSDKTIYNIKISRAKLLKQDAPNDIVLDLVKAAGEYGAKYNDTFPVTRSGPFSYTVNTTASQENYLKTYFEYFHLDPELSAPDFIAWLRDHYGISYTTTAEDARLIIGVRYELELRAVTSISDYVFVSDAGTDFITYIMEQNVPCVSVEPSSVRQYHTKYASHLLGNIGYIDKDDAQKYKDLGYALDSYVGKNGVEYAFEEYLHGTDGSVTVYTDADGLPTDRVINSPAKAGDNVYLTIDIELQQTAEDSLAATIEAMNEERTAANELNADGEADQELAEGGAAVVIDVRTGDTLASASYPGYDLSEFSKNYGVLSSDPLKPLFNRATQGTYNPGSTFKMVTAMAGLTDGVIAPYTTVRDEGVYMEYEDVGFTPKCWIYPGHHGTLDVVGALENSCNYFFYWLADRLDINRISGMAQAFGFGSVTGIEIGERAGTLASREYKKEVLNEGWWNADTLITAIGQGYNMFTPIQIANYVATIANGGTRYKTTILKNVTSSNYSEIILDKDPEINGVIDDTDGYLGVIQKGMRAVATTGTASSVFSDYPIPVAAKTGTVQSDTASMNTGVFVCYAPADDPEIAIAVVVEKGGSGSAITSVAKDILNKYFSGSSLSDTESFDNSLIK